MKPRTFYDKIWADHLVDEQPDGTCLLYIDRHIVHEVTSPQAFEGLRLTGRKVHAPDKTLLVVDHNVPTTDRSKPNPDKESADQIAYLAENAKLFGLEYLRRVRYPPGHLPRHRPRAGLHPAGRDAGLRRQPHRDARRVRRAGLRHRHLRGRARARHADAGAESSRRTCARWSTASCRRTSPPRTSSSPSSARSAPRAAPAIRWNTPARRSARCRWKAA